MDEPRCFGCGGLALPESPLGLCFPASPVLCISCGNPATSMSPLILSRDGRPIHAGLADPVVNEGRAGLTWPEPCGPQPKGWGWCGECQGAFPLGALATVGGCPGVIALAGRAYDGDPNLRCKACSRDAQKRGKVKVAKADSVKSDATKGRAEAVPVDGPGLTRVELMSLWGLGERQTHYLSDRLVEDGSLLVEEVPGARGGSPVKRYRKAAG